MEREPRWTGELALLVVCLIWGCNFAVMKSAVTELHPFAVNAIRLTLSVLFLGAVHYRQGGHRLALPPGTWPRIFGIGMLGYFLYQVLFVTGLRRTESGNAALILSSSPVFTVLLGYFLGERLRRGAVLGLGLALAGAVLIALAKEIELDPELVTGNLLTLAAACAWGSYTALTRSVSQRVPPASLAFYTTVVSLPFHWAIGFSELGPLWRFEIPARTWAAIAYAGLLGTGWAYVLWNIGIKSLGAAHTAGFVNLVPVIAVVVGWTVLGESVTLIQVLGGGFVLGGVWMMRRARTRP